MSSTRSRFSGERRLLGFHEQPRAESLASRVGTDDQLCHLGSMLAVRLPGQVEHHDADELVGIAADAEED